MKKLVLIAFILLLSGCAVLDAYLMKYDTNEYRIITEIRAEAKGYKEECNDPLLSRPNAIAMADKTNLFVMYSQYLPHNKPVITASMELDKIAQGLKTQYTSSAKVSPAFCKIKFQSIETSAESMQKIIGDKPR
jgi:sugar diacid utilization regulator